MFSRLQSSMALRRLSIMQTKTTLIKRPGLKFFTRPIYTDQFLNVDVFIRTSQYIKSSFKDVDDFKSRMLHLKSQNVLPDDIVKLINLASNDVDFDFIRQLIVHSLKDKIDRVTSYKPVSFFFMQCLSQLKVVQASLLWNDTTLQKSGILETRALRIKYLTLLYRTKHYDEIITVFEAGSRKDVSERTLVVAALLKIGTEEAFSAATNIFWNNKPQGEEFRSWTPGGRITSLYAYFAYKTGNHSIAYDVLTDVRFVGRPNKFTSNLKLLILTEVGRLNDALNLIRCELLLPREEMRQMLTSKNQVSQSKRIVFLDVMKKLTSAIKSKNDPELLKELASVCATLDTVAILTEDTLEKTIFEPISIPKFEEKNAIRNKAKKHNLSH